VPGNPDGHDRRDYRAQTIPENPSYIVLENTLPSRSLDLRTDWLYTQ